LRILLRRAVFDIGERLRRSLTFPVFHDDQHGTAVVILAGLLNAGINPQKDIRKFRVVIAGAGAAGTAASASAPEITAFMTSSLPTGPEQCMRPQGGI
jgi:malic enzyme